MAKDKYIRKYSRLIRISKDAHKRLAAYKKLTGGHKKGSDFGWQIDALINKSPVLDQKVDEALAAMIKVSPLAREALEKWDKAHGESPQAHIDRLLNQELGLLDWKKPQW